VEGGGGRAGLLRSRWLGEVYTILSGLGKVLMTNSWRESREVKRVVLTIVQNERIGSVGRGGFSHAGETLTRGRPEKEEKRLRVGTGERRCGLGAWGRVGSKRGLPHRKTIPSGEGKLTEGSNESGMSMGGGG